MSIAIIWKALIIGVLAFVIAVAVLIYIGSNGSSTTVNFDKQKTVEISDKTQTEDAITRYTFFLMLFTAILAAVGLIQILFLISADYTSKKAAEAATSAVVVANRQMTIAQDQYTAEYRPWISLDIRLHSSGVFWDVNGLNISLEATFQNIGKSPAIYSFTPHTPFTDDGLTNRQRIENACLSSNKSIENRHNMLFPGQKETELFTVGINREEIQKFWERQRIKFNLDTALKRISPIIVGCIGYKTPVGSTVYHTADIFDLTARVPGNPGARTTLFFDREHPIASNSLALEKSFPDSGYAD